MGPDRGHTGKLYGPIPTVEIRSEQPMIRAALRAGRTSRGQQGRHGEVVGVDGCKAGWVGIVLHQGVFSRAVLAATFPDLLISVPNATVVAVDIPIGLPATTRRADLEARRVVGARSSSVFPTPPRAVIEAATYEEANQRSRSLFGRGISQQTFALAKKILEVERCRTDAGTRLYEVHPEVSFWALAGTTLHAGKHSWTGHAERRALLEAAGIVIPADLGRAGLVAAADDVLDAGVAAWSAQRLARGHGRSLPEPPERDSKGRPIAIWY
jgi:predicted RNase H-like nuclease